MAGFFDQVDKVMEEKNLGGNIDRESYATGIDYIDYMNGKFSTEGDLKLGVSGGKIFYIAGGSGSGKSSFGLQSGYNIIKDYEDGLMFVYDCEKSNSHERIAGICHIDSDEYNGSTRERSVRHINDNTSTEGLYDLIHNIHQAKMNHMTGVEFLKDGSRSKKTKHNEVRNLAQDIPPTVILVDSWANLAPEKMDIDEGNRGSMDASAIAKANNGLIKGVMNRLFEANIILIIINHV